MLKNKIIRSVFIVFIILALGILFKYSLFKGSTKKLLADCNAQHKCNHPPVVILHGLVRSSASMNRVSKALHDVGYTVCNVQYPSRKHSIAILAEDYVYLEIQQCFDNSKQPLNFVTHSLGGIIVRQLAQSTDLKINRVVMFSPPNHGSELVDKLKFLPFFEFINGQAGLSIGANADSVPNTLGAVDFETGIIVGNKSLNPIYSYLIPGEDDGKVAIASAKVAGMRDFIIVPHSHSLMMNSKAVIEQTIHFLEEGKFSLD